jgi:hypothetical protein
VESPGRALLIVNRTSKASLENDKTTEGVVRAPSSHRREMRGISRRNRWPKPYGVLGIWLSWSRI